MANKQNKLDETIELYRSIKLARHHYTKLCVRLDEAERKLDLLTANLEKEHADVLRLEKTSLKGIFTKILINHEKQYEIEKQEYLYAVLQYNECIKTIELLEFEKKIIEEKLKIEKEIENQLHALLLARDTMISEKYPLLKKELVKLNKEYDHNLGYKRELHEAIIVGLKAQDILQKMIDHIQQATKNQEMWGAYREMPKSYKEVSNSQIDKAHALSYKAKQYLQELEDELEDIYRYKSIRRFHRIEEFQHFHGIYYDRLISDWIIQKKLVSTVSNLIGIQDSVKQIVATLKIQLQQTERANEYLEQRKKEVLIGKLSD